MHNQGIKHGPYFIHALNTLPTGIKNITHVVNGNSFFPCAKRGGS